MPETQAQQPDPGHVMPPETWRRVVATRSAWLKAHNLPQDLDEQGRVTQ